MQRILRGTPGLMGIVTDVLGRGCHSGLFQICAHLRNSVEAGRIRSAEAWSRGFRFPGVLGKVAKFAHNLGRLDVRALPVLMELTERFAFEPEVFSNEDSPRANQRTAALAIVGRRVQTLITVRRVR